MELTQSYLLVFGVILYKSMIFRVSLIYNHVYLVFRTMSSFEVEQSFRNIIRFYSKELHLISNGHKASKCFTEPQRKKLTKIGVLERIYVHQGCRLKLSDKAKDVLFSAEPSITL
jgi:hypothetical protein